MSVVTKSKIYSFSTVGHQKYFSIKILIP